MSDARPVKLTMGVASLLFVIAFGLSIYLAVVSTFGQGPVGCGPESSCSDILSSRWARIFGVSVGWPAAALYLVLAWTSFSLRGGLGSAVPNSVGQVGSVLVVGAAIWFVCLQAFVEKAFCPWCLATHSVAVVGSVLLTMGRRGLQYDDRWPRAPKLFQPELLALTLALLVGFAAGQGLQGDMTASNPRTVVDAPQGGEKAGSLPVEPGQEVDVGSIEACAPRWSVVPEYANPPGSSLSVGEIRGALGVSQNDWKESATRLSDLASAALKEAPIIGPRVARRTAFSLFDYTCHHCRDTHAVLKEAQASYGDALAIVQLPMPLDAACNHTLSSRNIKTQAAHENACRYARLGLALWRVDWRAYYEWEPLMFGNETTPLDVALARALELVDAGALNAAMKDPWIDQMLALSTLFYERNAQTKKRGELPQLLAGTETQFGVFRTMDDVYAFFGRAYGAEYLMD